MFRTDIGELIDLKVDGAEEEDDTYDKAVEDFYLIDVQDFSLTLQVVFRTYSDITTVLYDPDILLITFIAPELFIDAEALEHMNSIEAKYEIELGPQYSKEDLEEL